MVTATRILIAPGVYTGNLTAPRAAAAIQRGLARSGLAMHATQLPVADGGVGTLDAVMAAHPQGTRHTVSVRDPLGRPVRAEYGLIDGGATAVIEVAQITGADYPLLKASTYGVGQLLKHMLDAGGRRFVICADDNRAFDGGMGCLMALGVQFADANGRRIVQQGAASLEKVAAVNLQALDPRWRDCDIAVAVNGKVALDHVGTAYEFTAEAEVITRLQDGLRRYFDALAAGTQPYNVTEAGTAGGLATALQLALDARRVFGCGIILDRVSFDTHVAAADLVVTGGGPVTAHRVASHAGIVGVAQRARRIPTVALTDGLTVTDEDLHRSGLAASLPIMDRVMPPEIARLETEALVERAALRLGYLLKLKLK
jgi:glycerate 2-kinase